MQAYNIKIKGKLNDVKLHCIWQYFKKKTFFNLKWGTENDDGKSDVKQYIYNFLLVYRW